MCSRQNSFIDLCMVLGNRYCHVFIVPWKVGLLICIYDSFFTISFPYVISSGKTFHMMVDALHDNIITGNISIYL